MQYNVNNDIYEKIKNLGYKIDSNGKLKKKGKHIDVDQFYSENSSFHNISLMQFKSFVAQKASDVAMESAQNASTVSELLSKCSFIYKKFRWYVTGDKIKVFYLKMQEAAEEYQVITTDLESVKYFNCLEDHELVEVVRLVREYNSSETNKTSLITPEKLMLIIMEDLRANPNFRLPMEPVTLTNDPSQAAYRFFDIFALKKWGLDYEKQNGSRPPTPAWDSFFSRMRDQTLVPIVKAFFCGIFVSGNRAKQCLYIWGNGDDGKSQITEALAAAMGDRVTFNLDQHLRTNQFTTFTAYGKRLGIGEEMSAPNVIKNKYLHAITGNSRSLLEEKNQNQFSARLYSCVVITSNDKPLIEDVKNQTTRLLYVEVDSASDKTINEKGNDWGRALQTEFEAMIYDGIKYFKEYNPDGSSYRLPEEYKESLAALHDEETVQIETFIDKYFIGNETSKIKSQLQRAFRQFVQINYFGDQALPPEYRNSQLAKKLYEKLKLKFSYISQTRIRVEGEQHRIIIGLELKEKSGDVHDILAIDS